MQFDSEGKKRPYLPPKVRKLTFEQAQEIVACDPNFSHDKAVDLLESLRRELQQNEK
jgi:hypothetical protein